MRERWVDCDGRWVHTVDWEPDAPRADRPPLLLVHGLGGSTVSWEPVAGDLATRLETRVGALDLPGFGRTRTDARPAVFEQHGKLLEALLTERGPAVIVGNSMGGSLGVALAARRPDLVAGLVLVNAAFPRPRGNAEQLARTARFAALMIPRATAPLVRARANALGPEGLVDTTLAFVLEHPENLDPEVRRRLISAAEERRAYPEMPAAYAQSGGSLFRYLTRRMRTDMAAVRAPTLVLHGKRDRLVPVAFARAAAHRRPDWSFVELDDCGHAPQLEQPAHFVDLVSQWLERSHGVRDRATPA